MSEEVLTCIDCHKADSTVKQTTTPDRRDFKTFPRCEPCYDRRLAQSRRTMGRYPEAFSRAYSDECW